MLQKAHSTSTIRWIFGECSGTEVLTNGDVRINGKEEDGDKCDAWEMLMEKREQMWKLILCGRRKF